MLQPNGIFEKGFGRVTAVDRIPPLPLQLLDTLPSDAELRIGLPIDTAAHGAELIAGAYLAITHHRQAGGKSVQGVWYDDRRNAEGGCDAAEKLVGAGVHYVVGHFSSSAALAAAPIYGKSGVLFIASGSSCPELTGSSNGATIFRLCGRDDAQATLIAGALQQAIPQEPVELYAEDNRYGRSVSGLLTSMLRRAQIPSQVSIVRSSEGIVSSGIGPVVLAGTHEFCSHMLRRLNPQRRRIVTDDAYTPAFLRESGAMAEGVLVPVMGFDTESDQVRRLSAEYLRLLGTAPGGYFLSSYVAVTLILDAIRSLGDCGGQRIAEYLRSRPWCTPLGVLQFDQLGEVHGLIWQLAHVETGKFVLPKGYSPAVTPDVCRNASTDQN